MSEYQRLQAEHDATINAEQDRIHDEALEKAAHEAEVFDSEPLSGKSIAERIRQLKRRAEK